MITTQPIPSIPLWAWELDVPLQLALSLGALWATWWLMCSKNRLIADTNGRQLAYASLAWMTIMTFFLFGSIFSGSYILDPTENPKIGFYAYWFVVPTILVTLVTVLVMVFRMWTIWGYWTDPRLNPGRRPQANAVRRDITTQICKPDTPVPAKPDHSTALPAERISHAKPPTKPPLDDSVDDLLD